MSIDAALQDFYTRHGFGPDIGARPRSVRVYTGCLLVPLPNIETRHKFLKYHDLHHILTGYSVGRIGEGEISAWELGSGSMFVSPLLGAMNLIALSTGWVLERERMWGGFCRGKRSESLYRKPRRKRVDAGAWQGIDALRDAVLDVKPVRSPTLAWRLEFASYVALSLVIHATIAIPAVIVRTVADLRQGKTLSETLTPARRADLY
jgi:hypothetical protein